MGRIQQIEEEFGEPFFDVVKGFAEMNYSRRGVAQILGIDRTTFCHMLLTIDPNGVIDWPSRGTSVLVIEGIQRRTQDPAWKEAVTAAQRRRRYLERMKIGGSNDQANS